MTEQINNLETFLTYFASGVLRSITLNDGHGFTTSVAYKTNGSDIKINGQAEITITIEKDGKSATKNIILNSSDKTKLELQQEMKKIPIHNTSKSGYGGFSLHSMLQRGVNFVAFKDTLVENDINLDSKFNALVAYKTYDDDTEAENISTKGQSATYYNFK